MATATQLDVAHDQSLSANLVPRSDFGKRIATISKQSSIYFTGTIFTSGAGYFFKVYLARKLGAEALGVYALGITIVGFLGLFNGLGLPTAASRFVSAYRARGDSQGLGSFLRGSLVVLCGCNAVLGVLLLATGSWVAVRLYHLPALTAYLWAFALIMLFGALNTFLGQVMAGYQDVSRRTLITHFTGTPVNIVFTVCFVTLGFGLTGYFFAQILSALIVFALLAYSVWKRTPFAARRVQSFAMRREVFAFSAVAFGTTGLEFVLAQSDKIILGCMLSAAQVGVYAVATALVTFVPIALQSVNQIFSPTIAELHANGDRQMLQQLYSNLTKWILIFTLPLAITMTIFCRHFMAIFGPSFSAGAPVLAIGTVGQLLNCAVGSVGFLLLMSGHQAQLLKIQAVNAGLMIILTAFLTARMGISGAAIASAISVVTTNLWCLKSVHKRLGLFPFNLGYLKLGFPAVVTAAVLLLLERRTTVSESSWEILVVSLAAAYICFLAMVSVFALETRDRELGRLIWERISPARQKAEVLA